MTKSSVGASAVPSSPVTLFTALRCRRLLLSVVTPSIAVLCTGLGGTNVASAQERLVGNRTAGVGVSYERVTFGGAGLLQAAFDGADTARVQSVDQFTVPITASTALGAGGWRLDVTTLYASGQVTFSDARSANGTRTATLGGLSDIRTRATGRFLHDAVVLTVGLNVPTGQTSLNGQEFSALRIVASPALGLGSSPVGSGLSGTVGLVFAQQLGAWSLAYGSSYEARGKYQPVAALVAGTGASDFLPGGVFRASLGADRLIGAHRLSVAAAADVFAADRLRGVAVEDAATGARLSDSRVQLGPVLSADVQLLIAAPTFRELLAYGSFRWRAPFARDGKTVERSSGQYVEAGTRAVVPWGLRRGVVLSADARWHSGLGVDQGLPTAGVTSGALSAGVQIERGLLSFYPYVRAQGGSLRQRNAQVQTGAQGFAGAAGGLVIVSRF